MLKAAVIGAGYIARQHLDALRTLAEVEIAGVCDLSPTMAEAAAEEFGARAWYTSHHELLECVRPDVVHVTTPPRSHVVLARDCLEAGAHVLVEKPIAIAANELDALQRRAAAKGLWLLEDYNYLFNASVREIRRLVDSGELGDVVHVDAMFCVDILGRGSKHAEAGEGAPFRDLPGGPILDFLTHLAYLAVGFVGGHERVATSWRNVSGHPTVPFDEFRALVQGERGTACLGFSSHAQPDVFSLQVHGTRMRATASLFEPLLVVAKVGDGPRPLVPVWNGLAAARSQLSSAVSGLWRKLQGRPGTYEGLWLLLAELYGALREGGTPPVPPDQIHTVNRLVQAILAQAGEA